MENNLFTLREKFFALVSSLTVTEYENHYRMEENIRADIAAATMTESIEGTKKEQLGWWVGVFINPEGERKEVTERCRHWSVATDQLNEYRQNAVFKRSYDYATVLLSMREGYRAKAITYFPQEINKLEYLILKDAHPLHLDEKGNACHADGSFCKGADGVPLNIGGNNLYVSKMQQAEFYRHCCGVYLSNDYERIKRGSYLRP